MVTFLDYKEQDVPQTGAFPAEHHKQKLQADLHNVSLGSNCICKLLGIGLIIGLPGVLPHCGCFCCLIFIQISFTLLYLFAIVYVHLPAILTVFCIQ